MAVTDDLRELAIRMDGLVPGAPDMLREAADTIDDGRAESADLREELRDMFGWLVAYITPEQAQAWEDRLGRVGVTVDWGWRG